MNNAAQTPKPLTFKTEESARQWLENTNNYGYVHGTWPGTFLVLQFRDPEVWAFVSEDTLVSLPEW